MLRDQDHFSTSEHATRASEARRRALRAARVVTLGLALAGCSASHEPAPGGAIDAALAVDAGGTETDAGTDAGTDTGRAEDAGMVADAGSCGDSFGPEWEACCQARDWDPDAGCLAWGPYVPPGATMPESRATITFAALAPRVDGSVAA